jgi:hypothetical protein
MNLNFLFILLDGIITKIRNSEKGQEDKKYNSGIKRVAFVYKS